MGLELLQQELHDPSSSRSAEDTDAMLRMICESVDAACAIFDDLLQFDHFADVQQDEDALDKRPLAAWRTLFNAAEPLTLQAEAANVHLKWSASALAATHDPTGALATAAVHGDARKLAYVVRTLLSTAVQNTARGASITLDARLAATNGAVKVGAPRAGAPGKVAVDDGVVHERSASLRGSRMGNLMHASSVGRRSSGGLFRRMSSALDANPADRFFIMEITHTSTATTAAAAAADTANTNHTPIVADESFKFRPDRLVGGGSTVSGGAGSGLFMALSKRIVELHGGQAWVAAAPTADGATTTTYGFGLPLMAPGTGPDVGDGEEGEDGDMPHDGKAGDGVVDSDVSSFRLPSSRLPSSRLPSSRAPSVPCAEEGGGDAVARGERHAGGQPPHEHEHEHEHKPGLQPAPAAGAPQLAWQDARTPNGAPRGEAASPSSGGFSLRRSPSRLLLPPPDKHQFQRVLIVEDALVCRAMLRKVLKTLHCTATDEAEDGAVAVEKVRGRLERGEEMYDLILCDNVMPNMVGPEAVARIRQLGYTGPIFGVTGNMVQCDVDAFLASGCDEILAKPLKMDSLAEAMRRHSTAKSRRRNTVRQKVSH